MAFRPRLTAAALATVLCSAVALPALAQPAPPAAPATAPASAQPAPRTGMDQLHATQRAESRQLRAKHHAERLKAQLQITPAQEPAWNAFNAAMQPPAGQPPRFDRGAFANLSTPERLDRMRALRTQRAAEQDKRADAIKTFYAALTPEQKKVFDKLPQHRPGMGRPGMGHPGMHDQGMHRPGGHGPGQPPHGGPRDGKGPGAPA